MPEIMPPEATRSVHKVSEENEAGPGDGRGIERRSVGEWGHTEHVFAIPSNKVAVVNDVFFAFNKLLQSSSATASKRHEDCNHSHPS